jgi:hypothetical protein
MPPVRRILLGLTACGLWLLLPDVARAKPDREEGFHSAGFLYGALPFLSIPVGDDPPRPELATDISVQWGVGGGYMFMPTAHFMATVGAAFEYAWVRYKDRDPDFRSDVLRFLPELRIGGGNRRIFGYGFAQPGLAIFVNTDWRSDESDVSSSPPLFNLGAGVGAQGIVWRNLMIGGEVGVDLRFQTEEPIQPLVADLDLKILLGWYF